MKTKLITLYVSLFMIFCMSDSFSQGVSINSTGAVADTSAMLDVSSTTKGLLIPRMTKDQRLAIVMPANGLLLYQTDGAKGLYLYLGSDWVKLTVQVDGVATLTTNPVTNITGTTAVTGGNITSDGGTIITSRGVCWSTNTEPTTANDKTIDGSGAGSFTSNISGLSPSGTYYVRAYATNDIGTAYGNEYSFTNYMATLTTIDIGNITGISASSGGNISSDGGSVVTARGVCWSTNQGPTIANSKTDNGSGVGIYSSNITGLNGYTTYYVRAYAINGVGTAYGNELSFQSNLSIGQSYGGGIVFYIAEGEHHGLVCAEQDQTQGISWWNNSFINTGATGTSLGTGQSNTTIILNTQGAGSYAASICDQLDLNGYNDWYLPSIGELQLMFIRIQPRFEETNYWSSSEINQNNSYSMSFDPRGGGTPISSAKNVIWRVRAVRSF